MKTIIYVLFILLLSSSCSSNYDLEVIELSNNDTLKLVEVEEVLDSPEQTNSVFEGYEYAHFKLDYFHTEGYSTRDRYWYEIIIVDSLLILNFKSPQNDDWNYISYQKQIILEIEQLDHIKQTVNDANIHQNKEGLPHWSDWSGSGYGENRLYIESEELNISGAIIYNCIGYDQQDMQSTIQKEKDESTTIGGDYELLFKELEKLFDSLPFLMKDSNNDFVLS